MSGLGEFELIRRFFQRPGSVDRIRLGIGDDCALLDVPSGESMAISTDMLVEGRHFFAGTDPQSIGHKALAVNLSDLAAMGARPLGFTLAMAIPAADPAWLEPFARGLFALADRHGCALIGGDTTRGPLNLCVTVFGTVLPEQALRRDAARAGDDIWVSGALGGAAWAVAERGAPQPAGEVTSWNPAEPLREAAGRRLDRPEPRVALGLALRGLAGAAIDLSDGLLGDLGHVLERSSQASGSLLGARLRASAIPIDPVLDDAPLTRQHALALAGGDDYELLFTAAPGRRATIDALGARLGIRLTRIGDVVSGRGVRVLDASDKEVPCNARSFDHFL